MVRSSAYLHIKFIHKLTKLNFFAELYYFGNEGLILEVTLFSLNQCHLRIQRLLVALCWGQWLSSLMPQSGSACEMPSEK